eukprot:9537144-Alexandrium_andersonii.AAC.1
MASPWHMRPLVAQGGTSCGKGWTYSSKHCTSCVDLDSYSKLCDSPPSASTQSSGRSSLN